MSVDLPTSRRNASLGERASGVVARLRRALDRQQARWRCRAAQHRWIVRAAAIGSMAAMGYAGWFIYDVVSGLPSRQELESLGDMSHATTLYDAADRPVFTIPTEYRIQVPLSRISPHLVHAILAVEDQRFYEHEGIDGFRIMAAALKDLRELEAAEGGSTITQQLARQSFLTRDKTLRRKLKEAILAERIEHVYSKDEILAFYLNRVYFGDGLYGAEAAAQGYFGKPSSTLTLAEAALLAGLVRAPSTSNPAVSLERALARRDLVLQVMLDQHVIDRAGWIDAKAERIQLRDTLRHEDPTGLHFKEQVRRWLMERFGRERVFDGRLRVYTTMDPAMQKAAELAVIQSIREIESRGARPGRYGGRRAQPAADDGDNRLQAALVALDPTTGEVRAMVGGRDAAAAGLNRAIQARRQAGSAFKPFVYAAALEAGYSPSTLIQGLDQPILTYKGGWLPEDEHSTAAAMTVRTALRTSSNRAAARTLEQIGIERTVSYAERLGIGSLPAVPSIALGSGEVTLLSMTSAYATFAHGGILVEPTFIRRVEDRSRGVLFRAEPKRAQVLRETTAFLMSNMLADVVDVGTAARVRRLGFTLPAAGKTGTTNNFVDAWFVGFTPSLVAGVWVGFDRPRTIIRNGFASELAVPLWTQFMKVATSHQAGSWFQPPPGVVAVSICSVSGRLASPGCLEVTPGGETGELTQRSTVNTEYFISGTEPTQVCPVHTSLLYDHSVIGTTGFESLQPPFQWPSITPAPAAVPPPPSAPVQQPAPTPAIFVPPPTNTVPLPPPPPRPAPPPLGAPPEPATGPASVPLPRDGEVDRTVEPPPAVPQ